MARWEPDSRERLRRAAIELYEADGFHETTVAALAARAGLTERTFFRHFVDKREVLFGGEDHLRSVLVTAVADAAPEAALGSVVRAGLAAVANEIQPRHAELRRREPIIRAHPELQERELAKLASWSAGLDAALRARSVAPAEAALAAHVAIAAFGVAARGWLDDPEPGGLPAIVARTLATIHSLL